MAAQLDCQSVKRVTCWLCGSRNVVLVTTRTFIKVGERIEVSRHIKSRDWRCLICYNTWALSENEKANVCDYR